MKSLPLLAIVLFADYSFASVPKYQFQVTGNAAINSRYLILRPQHPVSLVVEPNQDQAPTAIGERMICSLETKQEPFDFEGETVFVLNQIYVRCGNKLYRVKGMSQENK